MIRPRRYRRQVAWEARWNAAALRMLGAGDNLPWEVADLVAAAKWLDRLAAYLDPSEDSFGPPEPTT